MPPLKIIKHLEQVFILSNKYVLTPYIFSEKDLDFLQPGEEILNFYCRGVTNVCYTNQKRLITIERKTVAAMFVENILFGYSSVVYQVDGLLYYYDSVRYETATLIKLPFQITDSCVITFGERCIVFDEGNNSYHILHIDIANLQFHHVKSAFPIKPENVHFYFNKKLELQILLQNGEKILLYQNEKFVDFLEGTTHILIKDSILAKRGNDWLCYMAESSFRKPVIVPKVFHPLVPDMWQVSCNRNVWFSVVHADDECPVVFDKYGVSTSGESTFILSTAGHQALSTSIGEVVLRSDGCLYLYTFFTPEKKPVKKTSYPKLSEHPIFHVYELSTERFIEMHTGRDIALLKTSANALYCLKPVFSDGKFDYTLILHETDTTNNIINKNLIKYEPHKTTTEIKIKLRDEDDYLERFIQICQLIPYDTKITATKVAYRENGMTISPMETKEFMFEALSDFIERYLILGDSVYHTFNEKICSVPPYDVLAMGVMLHTMILVNYPLAIHLPLVLLEVILKKPFTVEDLAYFSGSDAKQSEGTLRTLCNVTSQEKAKYQDVCVLLSYGFHVYRQIDGLAQMNGPTLDYYISRNK